MAFEPASDILSRYTVLDLTRARAGPTAARQLADWGADVIKIETPGQSESGDLGQRHGPDFQNLHRNKRSLTLDLKSSDGVEIFNKLAADADVIIENYRPGVKFRLGIDYKTIRKFNPGIVYGSISGFGQDGPYRDRPGLDQIAQGLGGHMSVTGAPGEGPMRSGAAISDMTAGLLCANGILIALLGREQSGEGQWVNTSLLEAQIFLLDFQAARWLVDREVPPQAGNDHPTNVPMGVFKTRDGFINIAPMGHMWAKVCTVLGIEDIIDKPEFVDQPNRFKNRAKVNAALEAATILKNGQEWIELLNDAGIPCGPINTLDQTFADPQVIHLGVAQKVVSPVRGEIEIVGQPVHMSNATNHVARPSPEYGEHTNEILSELGYTDDNIAALSGEGVV
jgi:formyl-CoA transferase